MVTMGIIHLRLVEQNRFFFLVVALLLIGGCLSISQKKDFSYGLEKVNQLNLKYNTTMDTYPRNIQKIESMLADFMELKKLKLDEGQWPFYYLIDYEVLNLEAEKLYILGQKYGSSGTTKEGFGCKSRPLIIESAQLRNSSAINGFNAATLLKEFIDKYPDEANSVGFSQKNVLFLNATFYQISKEAKRDSSVINYFCPENVTLELYQKEIGDNTNLSEEFINNLNYGDAVAIWKKMRGIS